MGWAVVGWAVVGWAVVGWAVVGSIDVTVNKGEIKYNNK